MAKISNIDEILKQMKFLQIDETLLSTMAEIPFVKHNSSPRLVMRNGMFYQALKISHPDRKILQTGHEFQIGQYSFKQILKSNSKIVGIIPRYRKTNSNNNQYIEITILYIDLETKMLKHIDLTRTQKIHAYFGFEYEWNQEVLDDLNVGEIVEEDTLLAKSPNVADDDYYKYGVLANVARISRNQAAEDGMCIRKSFLNRFGFDMYIKAKVSIGPNDVLVNLYGDEKNYKPIPEPGDKIHESGALVVMKKYDPLTAPALMSDKALMDFDPLFDKALYLKGSHGEVVDVKVIHAPDNKNTVFNADLLFKYNNLLKQYYRDLYKVYSQEEKEHFKRFGNSLHVDKKTHRLLVEAKTFLAMANEDNPDLPGNIKGYYRKNELNILTVEFTVRYREIPYYGSKFADSYASKSVIVDVIDDKDMPDGVDVIIEAKTPISRMNAGGPYEHYFADASRHHKAKLTELFKDAMGIGIDAEDAKGLILKSIIDEYKMYGVNNKSYLSHNHRELISMLHSLKHDSIDYIFSALLAFVKLFSEEQYGYYKASTHEDKIRILYQVITEELVLFANNDEVRNPNKKEAWEAARDIENSEFKPPKKRLKFVNADGTTTLSKTEIRVAPMYLTLLCKLPQEMNSCATTDYNHHGLPVQPSVEKKTRLPVESRPTKNIGETESRAHLAYLEDGVNFTGVMINRANNIKNHASIYGQILRAEQPTNIEQLEETFEGNTILETMHSTLRTAGVEINYKEDKWYE